jgi:hypothetical protein
MGGFVLYGLGIGLGYYPILKTTWKYFPEKKGFLTGLILSVFGLCPFIFTSIADAVMNPDGENTKDGGIFGPEIGIKMKDFSLIMVITMAVCGILSQFLMFPLDNVVSTDNNQVVVEEDDNSKDVKKSYVSNEIYNNEKEAPSPLAPDNNDNQNVLLRDGIKQKVYVKEPFMQAFKSIRFHLFNFMSVGTLCKLN